MATLAELTRHWQQWGQKLKPLVARRSAKLHFPNTLRKAKEDNGVLTFEPEHPVCFHNAPEKASSSRARVNHKFVYFVDGNIEIAYGSSAICVNHRCSVAIFRQEFVGARQLKLELVDSLHFDVDTDRGNSREHTAFHPLFHVQRGTGLSDEICKKTISDALQFRPEDIQVDQTNRVVLGTPYIRIPTPQLDLFSVMTLIAADIFCNPKDVEDDIRAREAAAKKGRTIPAGTLIRTREHFMALLDLLRTPSVFREGLYLGKLRKRSSEVEHLSSALWYPEERIMDVRAPTST